MEGSIDIIHIPHIAENFSGFLCVLSGMVRRKKTQRVARVADKSILGENIPHTLMESLRHNYEL